MLLVGLGYRSLSVAPPTLLLIKWLFRRIPLEACRGAAEAALGADTADEVHRWLREAMSRYVDLRLLDPHGPLPARGLRT
jgi:signal transduction protein with GAF and PtsI domain